MSRIPVIGFPAAFLATLLIAPPVLAEGSCKAADVRDEFHAWKTENGLLEDAPQDRVTDWHRDYKAMATALHERCPESFKALSELFFSLHAEVPRDEVIRVADLFVQTYDDVTGEGKKLSPTPYFFVAERFLQPEIALYERIPELIEKGREEAAAKAEVRQKLPGVDDKTRKMFAATAFRTDWRGRVLLTRSIIRKGDVQEAMNTFGELQKALAEKKPPVTAPAAERWAHDRLEADFWRLNAELAELDERPLDAVAYYQKAYNLDIERSENRDRASDLWAKLGGTADGFAALLNTNRPNTAADNAPTSRWEVKDETLSFQLTDLEGNLWTAESLRGKKTLVNLWATWCGPCRQELPYVQKLHEQLAENGNDDIVVLTLNMDHTADVVPPYMEKNGLTLPVLLAYDYLAARNVNGIPRNWLLDGEGRLAREQVGFKAEQSVEDWIAEVLAEMDRLEP